MHHAAAFALLAFASFSTFAATPPPDTLAHRLDDVTVFATRLDQTAGHTGRHITVIPGAALGRYPVTSIDDLLRFVPALEVQSRGSFGAQADVSLRGSTFQQVLWLLDGMKLNDPLTGHFGGYYPITPAEIEQIEIVRGPGAALYGPDAVGGFINIVTKTFAATHRPDEATAAATFLAGEWNLKSTNAGFQAQQNGLRLGGGVLNNSTDGQLRPAPANSRSDVALNTYSLSAAYNITAKLSAAARAGFDKRDFNAQYFYSTSTFDQAREQTSRDWYQGQLRYEWNDRARTELQLVQSASTDVYRFAPTSAASDHLMHYLNLQGQHQQQLSANLRATLGGQADRRSIVSNDRGPHEVWHVGAVAAATAAPTAALNLTASLRLDHDQAYGTEVLPQLNASEALTDQLTVRAGVGRAIRAPDFTERYNNYLAPGTLRTGLNVGNPDLQAERTWNYEGGLDYAPVPAVLLHATYFRRTSNNQIDYVPTAGGVVREATGRPNLDPAASYRFAQNLFRVTTQGLETEAVVAHDFAPGTRLDARVGYTFLKVQNAEDIVSQYLANLPQHLVSGTLSLTTKRLNATLGGLWKQRDGKATVPGPGTIDRTLTPTYAVFNLRLEAALLPGRLWLLGQVQNLFDADYADLLGAQMPRRWGMAGLRGALAK